MCRKCSVPNHAALPPTAGLLASKEATMNRLTLISLMLIAAICTAFGTPTAQHEHEHPAGNADKLGPAD